MFRLGRRDETEQLLQAKGVISRLTSLNKVSCNWQGVSRPNRSVQRGLRHYADVHDMQFVLEIRRI